MTNEQSHAKKGYPGLPDNPPTFNVEFDYSVWTPDTTVSLVNVPWDNSYRDIVRFENEAARSGYFSVLARNASSISISRTVYLRYGEPIRLAVPFSAVNRCNYIIVRNPIQPVPDYQGIRIPDTFYYFINDVRYIAPNTTELDIQLDVWQTYYDRVEFDMCYVERGHIGIANENSTVENLADYLTEPEGLEIGNEYQITGQQWYNFQSSESIILILSTANLTADFGTLEKPNLETANGDAIDGLISGCNGYAIPAQNFGELLAKLSNYPWVSQCITMITALPLEFVRWGDPVSIGGINAYKINPNHPSFTQQWTYTNIFAGMNIPARYSELLKFYTSPYSSIELTNFTGSPVILKPEMLDYDNDEIHMSMLGTFLPSDARFYAYPVHVNTDTNATTINNTYQTLSGAGGVPQTVNALIDGGEYLDNAIVYDNFPQFSIVNNNYMLYMASTANTRAYQYQSADWTQQKALTGAQLAFNQSTQANQNMVNNALLGNNALWANTDITNEQAIYGGGKGIANALGTLGSGNALGAAMQGVTSLADAALSVNWNNQRSGIASSLNMGTTANNARLANYNRDTNYDYAQFAAKGDYSNTIAAIQAKVDDARLTQPSTVGQNGGQTANYACGLFGCLMRQKRLKNHFLNQVGEYWLRYGYAINRFLVPPQNLKCMSKVTFWKMQNVMIRALIPEVHKNAIRGIFEKGVSVWNNPAEINNIDLGSNKSISGVNY